MTQPDDWRARYYRAILDYLGAPDDIDLSTVTVNTDWTDAGGYSEYTNWDMEISMSISWKQSAREATGFVPARPEKDEWRSLTNHEVADLIRSFG